ncbi:MAG: bis(5'-nucleosyl)-tetraphosphatase (symmetrical) YqeK, partial [bacterium]|nr:bis(5'-nucleosyl)-tetraphosphatase (symmetrical) YqeK [bacterium]
MDKIDLKKITEYLRGNLSKDRFSHSMSVAETAKKIAKIIGGVNPEKAYLAGLVHDCSREMGDEKLVNFSKEHRIKIDHFTQKAPYLLHAAVGAKMAKKKFKITDNAILQAVEKHCVPKPYM